MLKFTRILLSPFRPQSPSTRRGGQRVKTTTTIDPYEELRNLMITVKALEKSERGYQKYKRASLTIFAMGILGGGLTWWLRREERKRWERERVT